MPDLVKLVWDYTRSAAIDPNSSSGSTHNNKSGFSDTTTPSGRMVLTVFAGMAEFELSLIAERTSAGRIAAKARGVRFGPSPALSAEQIAHARQLINDERKPVIEVARLLKVHRATVYRALNEVDVHKGRS